MNIPGFTAETSIKYSNVFETFAKSFNRTMAEQPSYNAVKAAFQLIDDLPVDDGEFGREVEICRSYPITEDCGSAPPGEDPPQCPTGETGIECWTEIV